MIKIIGGTKESEPFQNYVNLTIKSFLAIRKFHQHIFNMIKLMTQSTLDCFNPNSMKNLKERFLLSMNDFEAAAQMRKLIDHAYDNLNTVIYDDIQYL
jgi:phosphatidylinositol 4-kinase A